MPLLFIGTATPMADAIVQYLQQGHGASRIHPSGAENGSSKFAFLGSQVIVVSVDPSVVVVGPRDCQFVQGFLQAARILACNADSLDQNH